MDRRDFFKRAIDKSGKAIVDTVDSNVKKQASRWIRPPFAIDELQFLLACTRCGDCIEACPHDVIFNLSAKLGAKVAGTPALDLLNKGCHLCEDWPCVSACEPRALLLPDVEEGEKNRTPKLASAHIDTATCLPYLGPECGACADSCPVKDALYIESEKPAINHENCAGCGLCREACILEKKAINIKSLYST
jgi:ferredoxin-type protein NapG